MEAVENEDFGSFPCNELSFQENGLDNLEWLSQFTEEDSSFHRSLTGNLPVKNQSETKNPVQGKSCFTTPVQTKSRTKRTRTGGRVWPLGSVTLTGSSTSSSFSSTTTTAESMIRLPPVSKRRKTASENPVQPRRCSHCGVQKTPQWRTGPMGAKTLCNACGVRFKSGRIYRSIDRLVA